MNLKGYGMYRIGDLPGQESRPRIPVLLEPRQWLDSRIGGSCLAVLEEKLEIL